MDVSVGTRLRVLRKDAGLTQAQLAALAGTNQAAINRYETDRAAAPYRILGSCPRRPSSGRPRFCRCCRFW